MPLVSEEGPKATGGFGSPAPCKQLLTEGSVLLASAIGQMGGVDVGTWGTGGRTNKGCCGFAVCRLWVVEQIVEKSETSSSKACLSVVPV